VALLVEEEPRHEVAQVALPVVLERVAEEVVHVDHSEIAAHRVILQVAGLPQAVALVQLEDVGVHMEDDHIAGHLELSQPVAPLSVIGHQQALVMKDHGLFQISSRSLAALPSGPRTAKVPLVDVLLHARLGAQGVDAIDSRLRSFGFLLLISRRGQR
jgi:hypothetical protein